MKNDVAELESRSDRISNDSVTGVRKTESAHDADAPTQEIEIEAVELSLATQPLIVPATELRGRKTSVPPPLPAEALRLRAPSSIPPAADLKARLRPPAPPMQRATPLPPAITSTIRPTAIDPKIGTRPENEALAAELERLSKRMRERDAYLAELEAVYSQRSEALLAAEAKLEAQAVELALRAARIAELEAALEARNLQPIAAGDDLTRIRGIGPHYARVLQGLGVSSFAAIANWSPQDCTSFARRLKVNPGRVERDKWVEQARALCDAETGVPASEL
jgi:predicted flap endonuclease-1-like 5' DNA nuclease